MKNRGITEMDIRSAVKEKANYADIVAWFRAKGDLDADQLVLLADTITEMSEEIFEHYKSLCDIMKGQLQRIRRICMEQGVQTVFPDETTRHQIAYAAETACRGRAVLPEKYEKLVEELSK